MTPVGRPARWRSAFVTIALVATFAGGVCVTPGHGDEDDPANSIPAPGRVTISNEVVTLTLSAADQRNVGIATVRPLPVPAQRTTVGFGTVLDAASLADLSNRYRDADSGVRTVAARLAASRAAFERAKVLHRDQQNISTAQLQDAESSFEVDKAALAAARSRLKTVAANARQDWGNVLGAALIDDAPLIADLIERHDYLVKVTLPPGRITTRRPETAAIRMSDGPEIPIGFISPAASVDPKLQGTSYLYQVSAASGLLPGLRLQVSLVAETAEPGLAVPEAAVVWLQGKAWIYLRTGPTSFERRGIVPEHPASDGGYIVSTLAADAEIVVRGAQMLLSEEFRAQAPIED